MSSEGSKRSAGTLLCIAGILIMSIPFLRLLEAGLRMAFMSEHYGSFWGGLKKDIWFSDGWIAYIKTPLGLTMTLLPVVLLLGAVVCFFLAIRSRSSACSV